MMIIKEEVRHNFGIHTVERVEANIRLKKRKQVKMILDEDSFPKNKLDYQFHNDSGI